MPFILASQAQEVYYTMYPQRKGRASGEWWAACKVRLKLFVVKTFNDEHDELNKLDAIDYYQDDGSSGTRNVIPKDEVVFLIDANALMEEAGINDIYKPMDIPSVDQFINDNEDSENDEELYDSDSNSGNRNSLSI